MKRFILSLCLLSSFFVQAQQVQVGPTIRRPTVNGVQNLNIDPETGSLLLTPKSGASKLVPVDTVQIKGWNEVMQGVRKAIATGTGGSGTVAIGISGTETLPAGQSAQVINDGTPAAPQFRFKIPAGTPGTPGTKGDKGDPGVGVKGDPGNTGPGATIQFRNVYTGAAGTPASVTNVGTATSAVYDIVIPEGKQGAPGSATGTVTQVNGVAPSNGSINIDADKVPAGQTNKYATPEVIRATSDPVYTTKAESSTALLGKTGVMSMAQARQLNASNAPPAISVTDAGKTGLFYLRSGSDPDDGAITLRAGSLMYKREFERVLPEWFGAKGDSLTDDTDAIRQAALAAPGKSVYFTKRYRVRTDQILLPAGTTMELAAGASVSTRDSTGGLFRADYVKNIVISGGNFYGPSGRGKVLSARYTNNIRLANPNALVIGLVLFDHCDLATFTSPIANNRVVTNFHESACIDLVFSTNITINDPALTGYAHGVQFWFGDANPVVGYDGNGNEIRQAVPLSVPRQLANITVNGGLIQDCLGGAFWGSLGRTIRGNKVSLKRAGDVGFDMEGVVDAKCIDCEAQDSKNGNYSVFFNSDDIELINPKSIVTKPGIMALGLHSTRFMGKLTIRNMTVQATVPTIVGDAFEGGVGTLLIDGGTFQNTSFKFDDRIDSSATFKNLTMKTTVAGVGHPIVVGNFARPGTLFIEFVKAKNLYNIERNQVSGFGMQIYHTNVASKEYIRNNEFDGYDLDVVLQPQSTSTPSQVASVELKENIFSNGQIYAPSGPLPLKLDYVNYNNRKRDGGILGNGFVTRTPATLDLSGLAAGDVIRIAPDGRMVPDKMTDFVRKSDVPTGGGTSSGDMLKTTYDTDNNGVVDNAQKVGGKAATDFVGVGSDAVVTGLTVGANNVKFTNNGYKITGTSGALLLEQTGDQFGGSRLHLQNRAGVNGALIETDLAIADLVLKGAGTDQFSIRYEGRAASVINSENSAKGEFQWISSTGGTFGAFGVNKAFLPQKLVLGSGLDLNGGGVKYADNTTQTTAYVLADKNKVAALGTASTKDVAISGNASTTQVVTGNDSRLTDNRTPTTHTHVASEITSGVMATARLGTGTANGSTFLSGDGTWKTPGMFSGGSNSVPAEGDEINGLLLSTDRLIDVTQTGGMQRNNGYFHQVIATQSVQVGGMAFKITRGGSVSGATYQNAVGLYSTSGVLLAIGDAASVMGSSGWKKVSFTSTYTLTAGTRYIIGIVANGDDIPGFAAAQSFGDYNQFAPTTLLRNFRKSNVTTFNTMMNFSTDVSANTDNRIFLSLTPP